jgi:hypothetical protein
MYNNMEPRKELHDPAPKRSDRDRAKAEKVRNDGTFCFRRRHSVHDDVWRSARRRPACPCMASTPGMMPLRRRCAGCDAGPGRGLGTGMFKTRESESSE